jgi:hypothetical protein
VTLKHVRAEVEYNPDSERLPVTVGAIVPAPDGRTIFVLPWLGQTLIGTTDNDYDGDIDLDDTGHEEQRVYGGHERVVTRPGLDAATGLRVERGAVQVELDLERALEPAFPRLLVLRQRLEFQRHPDPDASLCEGGFPAPHLVGDGSWWAIG